MKNLKRFKGTLCHMTFEMHGDVTRKGYLLDCECDGGKDWRFCMTENEELVKPYFERPMTYEELKELKKYIKVIGIEKRDLWGKNNHKGSSTFGHFTNGYKYKFAEGGGNGVTKWLQEN